MSRVLYSIIFHPTLNKIGTRLFKPFSSILPKKLKIPVIGLFHISISAEVRLKMQAHYTSHLSRLLFWEGVKGWEYDTIKLFVPLIKNAEVFLDIGANVGYYSLVASGLNPTIKIIAFEPFPDAYDALTDNVQLNKFTNIQSEKVALSDSKGSATFFYKKNPVFPDYKYQLAGDNGLVDYDEDERFKTIVSTLTLDEYLDTQNLEKIDIIKMDTETTEYFILKGGKKSIHKFNPIILCEVLKGFNEEKMEELLQELEYVFFKVTKTGLRKVHAISTNSSHQNQYFFVPNSKIYLVAELVSIDR
ncbi:MAG: FkbM family methyltransferase [Dokdonia sp.]|jgi:FkbM family methyltransferase